MFGRRSRELSGWSTTTSARRRSPLVVLVALLGLVTTVTPTPQANAIGVGEARPSIDGGIGWEPCVQLVLRPNPSGRPATVPNESTADPNDTRAFSDAEFIQELTESVAAVNAAFARTNTPGPLMRVGAAGTTRSRGSDPNSGDLEDGTFTVAWESSAHSGAGGRTFLSWSVTPTLPPRPDRITASDIALNAAVLGTFPAAVRKSIITHELAHALGLDHVGSAYEAVSLGYLFNGDVGPGTKQVLTGLYNATCNTKPTFTELPFAWNLPVNQVVVGAGVQKVASTATTPIELGTFTVFAMNQARPGAWADQAVICREDVFADCLAGAALAGGGPVMFVPGGSGGRISGAGAPQDALLVESILKDALAPGKQLYVLGGPNAVSNEIFEDLRSSWPSIRRLSGPSRFESAVAIADEVRARYGDTGVALLARHDNPADAVTAGVAAGVRGHPILLTVGHDSDAGQRGMHPATQAWMDKDKPARTLVIGGPNAVPPSVETAVGAYGPRRVAGRSRTETSAAVASDPDLWNITSFGTTVNLIGANGFHAQTWNVVLAATPYADFYNAPVLTTNADFVPISQPANNSPGEPGWWLSHVPPVSSTQTTILTVFKIGGDTWTDDHVTFGVRAYTLLHKEG